MAGSYLKKWRKTEALVQTLTKTSSDDSSSSEMDDNDAMSEPSFPRRRKPYCQLYDVDVPDYVSSSDCTESESENNIELDKPVLQERLSSWAIHNSILHKALREVMDIFREEGHDLPLDPRTLMKTPRSTPVVNKCGGEYVYFGIEHGLVKCLSQDKKLCCAIKLSVNVDGIPIHKSSSKEFWPILCSFSKSSPFLVALYYGTGKPKGLNEYLHDFLTEYSVLHSNGFNFQDRFYSVTIQAFVCDAPARAYLKCIKGHTSFNACERCVIVGSTKENRTVFVPSRISESRTDESFQNFEYKNHQRELSPLTSYGIKCVSGFSLDYMHLVCLGVVRRMLHFFKNGPRQCRLSAKQFNSISDHLVSLCGKLPSEFSRQPRALIELERWKATELRQFLLYTGPVVLKKVVSSDTYSTFLILAVAISILLDENAERRQSYVSYAKELLQLFVNKSAHIFGDIFVVYNVHSLCHIGDDVENFNCSLNDISAFPFENHLQILKNMLRSGKKPLSQVWRRIMEIDACSVVQRKLGRISVISACGRDSVFLLSTKDVAFVKERTADGKFECDVIKERDSDNFFTTPCNSKLIDIMIIRKDYTSRKKILERCKLKHKMVCLPYGVQHFVVFPLLHEHDS